MTTSDGKIIGLLASARSDGNTATLAKAVFARLENATLLNVGNLSIAPFSYDNAHENDDFPDLAEVMASARALVFASPVYWYSMSAQMKTMFDRMTDMTRFYKPLGKALAGKAMFTISTGSGPAAPDSFTQPFADTAAYFNMTWGGGLHAPGGEAASAESAAAAVEFAAKINALASIDA